ncbi:hypothetical protein C8Q70DRAFT_356425 [Cubamyces menziesii]|nr:hypothetical protein C8Q70DRAFT_356425 [Cubamyces menziesii]
MPSIFLLLPPAPLLPSAPLRLPSVHAPLQSTPSCCSIRPARRPLCGPRASAPPSSLPLVCSSPPSLDTHWILRILTVLLTSISLSLYLYHTSLHACSSFVPLLLLLSLIAAILSIHLLLPIALPLLPAPSPFPPAPPLLDLPLVPPIHHHNSHHPSRIRIHTRISVSPYPHLSLVRLISYTAGRQ